MSKYFDFVSQELLIELGKVRHFIKKHNSTIGILTEEVVRVFLRRHLPEFMAVTQGFIQNQNGELSKQCDIIVYDCLSYAPVYKVNEVTIVPIDSVVVLLEVKTRIDKRTFHEVIDYFKSFDYMPNAKTCLFIFEAKSLKDISSYFHSYKHPGIRQMFDHDTFECLPDEITGLKDSYHLRKAALIGDSDKLGYDNWFFEDAEGSEINAMQLFYESVSRHVDSYIETTYRNKRGQAFLPEKLRMPTHIFAVSLFDM